MPEPWSQFATTLLLAASVTVLLAAVATDVAFRRVPNALSAILATIGLFLRAIAGSLSGGMVAALAMFAMAAFCWRRGWIGGGDVKLLAATALTVPPLRAPAFLLAVALAGGVLAVLYLLLSGLLAGRAHPYPPPRHPTHSHGSRLLDQTRDLLSRILRIERWRIRHRGSLPYAAAIAAGALFTLMKQ